MAINLQYVEPDDIKMTNTKLVTVVYSYERVKSLQEKKSRMLSHGRLFFFELY